MRVFLKGKEVEVLPLNEIMTQPQELSRKELMHWCSKQHKIRITHPFKVAIHRKTVKNRMLML